MDSNPPDSSLPALAGSGARYRSPRRLAKIVSATFVLHAGVVSMVALLLWDALDVFHTRMAGHDISAEAVDELITREADLRLIALVLLALCGVTFSMWTYRVTRNVVDTGGLLSFAPGLAVWYYAIPIIAFWRPYTALAEVWDASDPDRGTRGPSSSHGWMTAWWLFWIASRLAALWFRYSGEPSTLEEAIAMTHLGLIGIAMDLVAAGLALGVVWQLTHRQELRASSMPVARVV